MAKQHNIYRKKIKSITQNAGGGYIQRCHICHYFSAPKDICEDSTRSYIIVTNFFIGQHKIFLDGEFALACCLSDLFPCTLRWQIIYNRIRPCTAYKVRIFIFVYFFHSLSYSLEHKLIIFQKIFYDLFFPKSCIVEYV